MYDNISKQSTYKTAKTCSNLSQKVFKLAEQKGCIKFTDKFTQDTKNRRRINLVEQYIIYLGGDTGMPPTAASLERTIPRASSKA